MVGDAGEMNQPLFTDTMKAQKIEQLPFGDTSASFAIYVRECPPCNGNCNQGRTCPARK
jgi:hypothetical protein